MTLVVRMKNFLQRRSEMEIAHALNLKKLARGIAFGNTRGRVFEAFVNVVDETGSRATTNESAAQNTLSSTVQLLDRLIRTKRESIDKVSNDLSGTCCELSGWVR